jgi:hypothetical protein
MSETTETAVLTDGALVLLARAGIDLNVLDIELKFARIERDYDNKEGGS